MSGASVPAPLPAVSAVVKATVLDTAYLAVTVPHMLMQARFPFVERVVVVDGRAGFGGRFRARPRSTRAELDAVLANLLANGVVDRVVEVPARPDAVAATMARYFGEEGAAIPTHSDRGCAVLATLYGLECAASDVVLQLDSDMLFHARGGSWIAEGLAALADPSVWLVMTHGGPPAGPLGSLRALGPANAAGGAAWDPSARSWRFRTASTRYFLCDRRRLHGRVPPLRRDGGLLPLEDCLSAALERHGAFRVNLAREGSWDLHAFDHGPPFPAWAGRIAWLVEEGRVPPAQRGDCDLRLDLPSFRRAWQALIEEASRRAVKREARRREA